MFFKKLQEKGDNSFLVHLGLLAVVIFAYFILSSLPVIGLIAFKNPDNAMNAMQAFAESYSSGNIDWEALNITKNEGLAALLFSFISLSLPLVLFYKPFHGRSAKFLFTAAPKFRWKHFFLGVAIWGGLQFLGIAITYILEPELFVWQFQADKFIPLVIIGLLLFPIQTGTEELFFRGYLMQAIGLASKYRWVALLLTSIGFAVMHGANPEVEKYGFWVMMSNYMLIAITLGIVTLMDDGLEIAIGAHFINNFTGATFLTFEGSALQTDALFRITEIDPANEIYLSLVFSLIFIFLLKYFLKWKDWSKIYSKIEKIEINEQESTDSMLEERV